MTPRQKRILEFIQQYYAGNAYGPTLQEVCDAAGLASKSNAHKIANTLVAAGYLEKLPEHTRRYRPAYKGVAALLADITTPELQGELLRRERFNG